MLNNVKPIFYLLDGIHGYMKSLKDAKIKPSGALLGLVALFVAVTILPHAFAQVSYTDVDNPIGPLQVYGWATGMAVAGVLSGVGVWSAVRRH